MKIGQKEKLYSPTSDKVCFSEEASECVAAHRDPIDALPFAPKPNALPGADMELGLLGRRRVNASASVAALQRWERRLERAESGSTPQERNKKQHGEENTTGKQGQKKLVVLVGSQYCRECVVGSPRVELHFPSMLFQLTTHTEEPRKTEMGCIFPWSAMHPTTAGAALQVPIQTHTLSLSHSLSHCLTHTIMP